VANNQYAYSTPNSRQFACEDLVDRAIGYGISGHTVDGTNLDDCLHVVGDAVKRAREGNGPQLVIAQLLRLAGHGEHDDASYIDPLLKQSPVGQDCLKLAEDTLLQRAWASCEELIQWREAAVQQIEEAVATVRREPAPDPNTENWCALASSHLVDGFSAE